MMRNTRRRSGQGVITPRKRDDFVETPEVESITERALSYMKAGYSPLLSGLTGSGKTTLAFHLAAQLDQPAVLMTGDSTMDTSDLVGKKSGYRRKYVRDNYIRSVLKETEQASPRWQDYQLTTACKEGYTLIYDEYTRSKPETNNVLLTVLQEEILVLPKTNGYEKYVEVHPDFRAIFTANPSEYQGVYRSQNALRDRMIEISLNHYDRETSVAITRSKSGLTEKQASRVVDLVDRISEKFDESDEGQNLSLRTSIKIARIMGGMDLNFSDYESMEGLIRDVIQGKITSPKWDRNGNVLRELIREIVEKDNPSEENENKTTDTGNGD